MIALQGCCVGIANGALFMVGSGTDYHELVSNYMADSLSSFPDGLSFTFPILHA